jgi:hypothetical protein
MKKFIGGTLGVLIAIPILLFFEIWGAIAIIVAYFAYLAFEGN